LYRHLRECITKHKTPLSQLPKGILAPVCAEVPVFSHWLIKEQAGIVQTIQTDVYPKGSKDYYSLIFSYPPFIPVSTVRDGYEASTPRQELLAYSISTYTRVLGLYDQDERMLKILISQLPAHLAPNGKLLLIYPSCSTDVLKLRPPNHIQLMCEKYGLKVVETIHQEADKPSELPSHLGEYREPALIYRKRSTIQAFIIGRKTDKS